MGTSSRHFKALMIKNFINWKRTPLGSVGEIVAPILLMLILVWARSRIDPATINDYSLYSIRHPQYPIGKPENGPDSSFTVDVTDIPRQMENMDGFMKYADYTNIDTTIVIPVNVTSVLDTLGLDEMAEAFSNFTDTMQDYTNITWIWNETGISNLTYQIEYQAIESFLDQYNLSDTMNVTQLQVVLERPEETLAEALGMVGVDLEDVNAFDFEALDVVVPIKTYLPIADPLGPYLFYPPHCYKSMGQRVRGPPAFPMPVIAYVRTGNQIEQDLIDQMNGLFEFQRYIGEVQSSVAALAFISRFVDIDFVVDIDEMNNLVNQVTNQDATNQTERDEAQSQSRQREQSFDAQSLLGSVGNFTFKAFDDQAELDAYIEQEGYGRQDEYPGICFAFSVIENASNKYELEIQHVDDRPSWMKGMAKQSDNSFGSSVFLPDTGNYIVYQYSGFAYLQNWAANTILKRSTNNPEASIMTMIVPMRMRPWQRDDFALLLTGLFSFFVLVMFIPPVYRTVYRIVAEKENRAKEAMRMMGLKDMPYWTSWFVYYTIVNTLIVTLSWIILVNWVFQHTDWLILYLVLWIYGQSIFGLIMITQSLFTRARAAAITTSLIYFGASMINTLIYSQDTTVNQKIFASLSPPVAMINSIAVLAQFEGSGIGIKWHNIDSEYNAYTVAIGLKMMTFNCVWLVLLGTYLEQVTPKTVGVRRHPCFFLLPKFWKEMFSCKHSKHIKTDDHEMKTMQAPKQPSKETQQPERDISGVEQTFQFETKFMSADCYERVQAQDIIKEEQHGSLILDNLKKTYDNGVQAVKGVNLKMYADQIFVLLGHNGAGKTSTIAMLTGLYRATTGTAKVFGQDILDDVDEVRKLMGVCPQHDVLFDLLTPAEHLAMFYEFKGADKSNKTEEINKLLEDIGVADKRDNLAKQLSGGNKRKLSVAIALCGGSKFVLLDEPTSGLDISARRQLWNMLKEYKKDRIILLTTHYMDEADILGDRIGIMHEGKMTCVGSPMFLKARFGVGYVMTIEKSEQTENKLIMPYFIARLGPDVSKVSEIAGEMTIQIPNTYNNRFKEFFTAFDDDLGKLEIQSYGISITTLEQVFLKIGSMDNPSSVFKKDHNTPDKKSKRSTSQLGDQTEARLLPDDNAVRPFDRLSQLNPGDDPQESPEEEPAESTSQAKASSDQGSSTSQNKNSPAAIKESSIDIENQDSQTKHPFEEAKKPGDKQILDENGKPFSLNYSKLDNSFWSNLIAILVKRTNNYKRNKKVLFNEVALPALAMIFGYQIASYEYIKRSDPKTLSPSAYKGMQNIFYNSVPVDQENSNVPTIRLMENLPQFGEYFGLPVEANSIQGEENMYAFADQVYDYGNETVGFEPYQYGSYEIYQANTETQEYKFLTYINLTSWDSSVLYPQFMYESILKVANNDPEFEFKVTTRAYPILFERKFGVQVFDGGTIIFFAAIAYSLLCTVTISYLVQERISMLKHVQVITGMRLSSYWIANFIFDFAKMYVTVGVTLIIFHLIKTDEIDYDSTMVLYALFPFGILPCTYVMSFLFTADSAAQTVTMFLHFLWILIFSTTIFLIRFANKLEDVGDLLNYVFKIFPSYSLGGVIYTENGIESLAAFRDATKGTGDSIDTDEWAMTNNSLDITMMGVHFVFWFFILFLIEIDLGKRLRRCSTQFCSRKVPKRDDLKTDDDVLAEQNRVETTPNEQFRIKVNGLRKVFWIDSFSFNCCCRRRQAKGNQSCAGSPLVAVEDLSFGLQSGECFALLGVNGAGKSTTFKSLTCEIEPTDGQIHIGSLNVRKDFNKIRKLIGYCPQTNPIFDSLTVKEHIEYFGRIKGIPAKILPSLVEQTITQLGLENYRKNLAGNLSGGNKRKLSVAIAVVGSPPIILLDEPSAGMDPKARRFMWEIVANIASNKTSAVVLTTHSMEEAEALSTKMGIMVKGGVFKCFGSSQHIRDKFGTGYIIEIKAKQPLMDEVEQIAQEKLFIPIVQNIVSTAHSSNSFFSKVSALAILNNAKVRPAVIDNILAQEEEDYVYRRSELALEYFTKQTLFGFVKELCETFGKVEVIEQYGNYMRLRVDKQDKTIGFLFKLAEELKERHDISEYSAHQTTLEQIFQGFANLTFNEKILTYTLDETSKELIQLV